MITAKYPRTSHLPWSLGMTSDDKMLTQSPEELFGGHKVVVTEKMDGENTTIYSDGSFHARSVNSDNRAEWRTKIGEIARNVSTSGLLTPSQRLLGENLVAAHSIMYYHLPGPFLMFGLADGHTMQSWSDVEECAALLDLPTAPVLYHGVWNEAKIKECFTGVSRFGNGPQEGYVVRLACSFPIGKFSTSVAKFVRANHVQTDKHWSKQAMVKNHLQSQGE